MSTHHSPSPSRISTKFEEEYVKTIVEARYSLKVSPKKDKGLMGATFTKLKILNSPTQSPGTRTKQEFCPEKENNKSPWKGSPKDKNSIHKKNNIHSATIDDTKPSPQQKQSTNNKKRKAVDIEDNDEEDAKITQKRKRINRIVQRLQTNTGTEQDNVVFDDSPVRGLRKTIAAKRRGTQKTQDSEVSGRIGTPDKKKNIKSKVSSDELNIESLYTTKLKEAGMETSTSPFKGKMSAFEISLLKGKQSVERRKSLEASTLRSSPRMNTNVPQSNNNISKQAKRSARSLDNSLTAAFSTESGNKLKKKQNKGSKSELAKTKTRKRRRQSSKTLDAVSPSSVENRFIIVPKPPAKRRRTSKNHSMPEIKVRSSPSKEGKDGKSSKATTAFTYRMNGSPKINGLPAVLSLTSLSGIPQKIQGSSFSSFHKGFCANGLSVSGKPPGHSRSPKSALDNKESPIFFKPSPRPSTLIIETDEITGATTKITTAKNHSPTKLSRDDLISSNLHINKISTDLKSRKLSLEETVNMLRHSSSSSKTDSKIGSTLSPTPSEGRVSMRSSRSSTPNISPMKSDILTPSCTPCSTPNKSPKASPCAGSSKTQKGRKRYLFGKHDDVLARWHDGLFYVGRILRIDDKHQKCLLRYEDNSEYWSLFKDIHRVAKDEEMICCICLGESSEPPNEIVLCDNCSQGYHQKCHSPTIGSGEIVDPDDEWYCRDCVFLMTVKLGGALTEDKGGSELKKMKQSLPYELESLTWDVQHKNNTEQSYCYCGGPGTWYEKMLQCCRCKQWFHEACMQCTENPLLFGDGFYIFVCLPCNFGEEYIKRLDVEWPDLVHIALFNMALDKRKFYNLESEIMPWLLDNWSLLQVNKYDDLSEDERFQCVEDALKNTKNRFSCGQEVKKGSSTWGLRVRVPPPRVGIKLPMETKVTDELMNTLKIKGRRSKVFVNVECKSPRYVNNQIKSSPHSPAALKISLQKQVEEAALLNKQRRKMKLPILERLIPRHPFTGHNHPFKNVVEQEEEKSVAEVHANIWRSFVHHCDTMGSREEDVAGVIDNDDLDNPPVLEKVEPIVPNCNDSPPMPEIKDKKVEVKKRGRKPRALDTEGSESKSGTDKAGKRRSRRASKNGHSAESVEGSETTQELFRIQKVKTGNNYYYAYNQQGYGQGGFHANGRRVNELGEYEYILHWDK